ncbi:MAG: translation initiation factor IF-1 [Methylacidiphilales bacterium]|nr:translation initiation factor IF-1 [Candidatus Methylacidiphilales bacterium]
MPERDSLTLRGTVVNVISTTRFRVELENGRQVMATLSGQVRLSVIRVLPGSKVLVEFSPYDLSQGRIIEEKEQKKI